MGNKRFSASMRCLLSVGLTAGLLCVGLFRTGPACGQVKTVLVDVRVDSQNGGYEGLLAMDGDPATMWHTDFQAFETPCPHEIVVDLGKPYAITGFRYLPRPGGGNGTIKQYECYVGNDAKQFGSPVAQGTFAQPSAANLVEFPQTVTGRYVRLRAMSEVAGRPWASIAELEILSDGVQFKAKSSASMAELDLWPDGTPKTELDRQFVALLMDIRNRAHFDKVAHQTQRPESLILASDRDPADVVLRRTRALLADLQQMEAAAGLAPLQQRLEGLEAANAEVPVEETKSRLDLYCKACGLRREIVFANPLLSFDKILFIKRHRSGFNHMCDQFYGVNMEPGGGLYVLSDPFGSEPQVRDVLADSVVERGRLQGTRLNTGSFLSPDLSYDASKIVFAYAECTGDTQHRFHTDPTRGHWNEGRCYHVFRVNLDGTGLEQLTDGTFNDFDPCWLPNDRLAFITERRGGYLRCGRVCPTYTLFDMATDGSDIRCLSFHETNEWQPSVTHDGRIIYTRWDYVDRYGCTAHLPWITTLDGCDSRAVHGNFAPRQLRPDMELDVRAVPDSHKYVATAAPHHGQAFGSLVLVDPHIEDDDAMAPVKRITPEVDFPESQGGAQVYGSAWPLSEKYYLCVYDASMRPGLGSQGRAHLRGDYGIYLVDSFGNRELLYRDPEIACLNPVPLRPTERPPVMAELAGITPRANPSAPPEQQADPSAQGTVAVIDVYNSRNAWPDGTKIKSLRVIQILPMTVPSGGPPHEVGLRLPSATDSVMLARYVLGTVPVEEDGSVHFTAPAHKELFFQALDDRGLAIQSMRSATYLQAGEKLVCAGCHERKEDSPQIDLDVPIALRRAPSTLAPDVEGSNPFSYARLVQPVLDRHCVSCHAEHADKAINLAREPIQRKFYASYLSLAPKYGFWNYQNGHRTTPGKFGARASKLLEILDAGHYDVRLSEEEMHRITLWLDCCSVFYGVYEKEGGEAQLRGEVVHPTLQ